MANYRKGNVQFVDTTADFTDIKSVKSIKYIGNTSGTASIKSDGATTGSVIWEESGTANVYNTEVCIYEGKGIRVEVTNSAKVYLYLE